MTASVAQGLLAPVAVAADLDNGRVMDQPVDGGDGHHLIREDTAPFGERLVGGDDEAAGLVAVGDGKGRWGKPAIKRRTSRKKYRAAQPPP